MPVPQPSVALLQRQCPASIEDSRRRRTATRAAAAANLSRRVNGSAASLALVVALLFTAGVELASGQRSAMRSAGGDSQGGPDVAAMQRALGVTADGVAGPRTIAAVRRFQQRRGLVVDGIAGPVTLAALGVQSATASSKEDGGQAAPRAAATSPSATLQKIARCESGGNTRAISANRLYRGKYQFSRETWRRLGGRGDPARAAEAEQDRIAAKQFAQSGTSAWPSCG